MPNRPIYLRKYPAAGFDSLTKARIYSPRPMADQPDRDNPWRGYSTGLAISGTLLSGLLVWGGIGYLIDRWIGAPKVFTAIGMVVGAVAGGYLVYVRYGRGDEGKR